MAAINPRPIIFPLSNPVKLSECQFDEAVEWTEGRVVFASGSPFPEYEYKGRTHYPGQGNNMYVFPGESLTIMVIRKCEGELITACYIGLGLGAIISRAASVTDSMVENASLALADSLTEEERKLELVYPRIERIRDISAEIATRVIRTAQHEVTNINASLHDFSEMYLYRVLIDQLTSALKRMKSFCNSLRLKCGIRKSERIALFSMDLLSC